LSISHAIKIS